MKRRKQGSAGLQRGILRREAGSRQPPQGNKQLPTNNTRILRPANKAMETGRHAENGDLNGRRLSTTAEPTAQTTSSPAQAVQDTGRGQR